MQSGPVHVCSIYCVCKKAWSRKFTAIWRLIHCLGLDMRVHLRAGTQGKPHGPATGTADDDICTG